MAMTPEAKVKAAIKKYLSTLADCWWFMPVSNGMGSMGIPDIIVCIRGMFLAIECKAPGKERSTTALQERQIAGINGAGGYAIVASSVEQVQAAVMALRLKVA